MDNMDAEITTSIYVDGQERGAETGATYDIFNPARTVEKVGEADAATIQDVNEAVEAAHRAFPAWAELAGYWNAQKIARDCRCAEYG